MQDLRKEIDEVDKKILELITRRFEIIREIALYKKKHHLPIEDKEREEEVYKKYKEFSDRIPKEFLEEFWDTMMYYSKNFKKRLSVASPMILEIKSPIPNELGKFFLFYKEYIGNFDYKTFCEHYKENPELFLYLIIRRFTGGVGFDRPS